MNLGIRHYSIVTALTCLIVTTGLLLKDSDHGTLLFSKSDVFWIGMIFFVISYCFVWVGGACISFIVRLLTDNVIAILVVFFIIALNLYFIGVWLDDATVWLSSIYSIIFGLIDGWLGKKRK